MAIKTSSAKAKGRRLQQQVCALVLKKYPKLQEDDVRSAPMGVNGEDVQLSPAARKCFPYSVECKSHKAFSVYGIYEQSKTNVPRGCKPIAVLKADRKDPLVLISLKHFMELV